MEETDARQSSGASALRVIRRMSRLTICCKRFWTKSVKSAVLFGSWLFDSCESGERQ